MGGAAIVINSEAEWTAALEKATTEGKAVIVDFTATWCGPCRMIGPYFEELSSEFTGIVFLKVDVDANDKVAAKCEVKAMPTFQVFVGGAKKEELVGASKEKLRALVEKYA